MSRVLNDFLLIQNYFLTYLSGAANCIAAFAAVKDKYNTFHMHKIKIEEKKNKNKNEITENTRKKVL